ncbi:UNVERIFIED_CONTAM: hypothetical protein FKN15_063334 [Acipenser sinensis]
MFMPDVAIQNAWLLYRNSAGHKNRSLGLLAFQREVVNVYRLKFSAEARNAPGIGRPLTAGRQLKAVQQDEQGHYPKTNRTQRRCAHCSKKAKVACCKCHVGLHIDIQAIPPTVIGKVVSEVPSSFSISVDRISG